MTKIKLMLPPSLYSCPLHWKNFVDHYNPNGNTTDHMNQILKEEYRAKISEDVDYVLFDNESDYVMFKLRWS